MKDTMQRLREALEEHFGMAHIRTIGVDEDLFAEAPAEQERRTMGDIEDRGEMVICVNVEFGIFLPQKIAATGPITLQNLANLVEMALASRDASPH